MADILYWVWLSQRLEAGSPYFINLLEKFGSPFDIYNADEEELHGIKGINEKTISLLSNKNLDDVSNILNYCSVKGITIISYKDKRYPERLRLIQNPPILLYCIGNMPEFDKEMCIAIVGARDMTEYGRNTTYKIAYELSAAGAVVVSGMALGIDSTAACAALEAGGKTVAVLGCGLDVVYPYAHAKLMKSIAKYGAVISEYSPSTPPAKYNFPMRNRIISGLCQGTLIADAEEGSGALITAKEAIIQGRDIFAIPANLGAKNSGGTNMLIQDGANVVLSSDDIIDYYKSIYVKRINFAAYRKAKNTSDYQEWVLESFGVSPNNKRSPSAQVAKSYKSCATNQNSKAPTKSAPKNNLSDPLQDKKIATLSSEEKSVFEMIPVDRATTIDVILNCGLEYGKVMESLINLELKGLILSLPGGMYVRQ